MNYQNPNSDTYCGYVALIGRPNVGKSTLLNCILQHKLSITSAKQQTTRSCIRGVKTDGVYQTIYVDTPGVQKHIKKPLNRYMNRQAMSVLLEVNIVVWILDRCRWTADDENWCHYLKQIGLPIILAVNKTDRLPDRGILLPHFDWLQKQINCVAIIPISAKTSYQVDKLELEVRKYLPSGIHLFQKNQRTDRSSIFLASELIREAMIEYLHQELPYVSRVQVEKFYWTSKTKDKKKLLMIHALIWVENNRQKQIVIGKGGQQLKIIGSQARQSLQHQFKSLVCLKLWVKVNPGWSSNPDILRQLA